MAAKKPSLTQPEKALGFPFSAVSVRQNPSDSIVLDYQKLPAVKVEG
jgi:hypothetical protein